MKKQLRFLAAVFTAGAIATGSVFTVQAYADNKAVTINNIHAKPHFDESGYVVLNGLQFHKTSDTTVEVSKGMDFDTLEIEIPQSISVDDVSYLVTGIAANAFKNTIEGDNRVYAAQKITIPDHVYAMESHCFYDLVNIESLDLTCLGYLEENTKYEMHNPVNRDILDMNSNAKLNRVKVNQCDYDVCDYDIFEVYTLFSNPDFHPVAFYDDEDYALSKWYIKDNVDINELQDAPVKSGYTFVKWEPEDVEDFGRNGSVVYTKYTPSYEKGESLFEAEDKIKSELNKVAVNENTKESEILELVKSCIYNDNISYTVDDFKIIPTQNEVRGKLKCTINLTNKINDSKHSIEIDKDLTYLPGLEKIKSLTDSYIYKDSTNENDIIDHLKTNLQDIGLDIKINNFSNDKKQVKGTIIITNKLDGQKREFQLKKAVNDNIKLLVEDAINNLNVNSDTKEESVRNQIAEYVGDDRYNIIIIDYENDGNKITGSVMVEFNDEMATLVDLNKCVYKKNQNLEQAYEIVKANLEKLTPFDRDTEEEVITYLSNNVETSAIEISISDFTNKKHKVNGTIQLYDIDKDESKAIDLNKTTVEGNIDLNINNMKTNKDTTEEDLYNTLKKDIEDINFEIKDFKNDNGHITAAVVIHEQNRGDINVNIDKASVSQTVQEAVDIINNNLINYVPANTTKGSEAVENLTKGIKDADILVTIPDFNNDGQTVTGTILIIKNDGTSAKVALNKKTALVGETEDNSGANGTQTGTDTHPGNNPGTNPGPGGTQTGSVTTPATSGPVNNSSTSSSSAAGGNASANPNNTNNNTNTTGASNSSVSGGNSTNNNTNTTGSNTNTTGNNSVSLDNLSISGGGSTSSTGAITVNPLINNSIPVNVTVNLNGFELANKYRAATTTTNGIIVNNEQKEDKIEEDDFFKLLILKYLQQMN